MNLLQKQFLDDNKISYLEYEFLDQELIDLYNVFQDKFERLFDLYSSAHNIKNNIFYIKYGIRCNAFARKLNGHNIIGITEAYPVFLKEKFSKEYFKNIILVGLVNNSDLSNSYAEIQSDSGFEFAEFMLDCSIQYTFSHEFRHIQQINSIDTLSSQSFYENAEKTGYSPKKHAWEFDADRSASYEVIKHVFSEYRKLETKNESKLKCLMYCALSSIIITKNLFYYNVMNQVDKPYKVDKLEFYTNEYSHPHPLVRVLDMFEYFFNNLESDFPQYTFDKEEMLINVMGISRLYFNGLIPEYANTFSFLDEDQKVIDMAYAYAQEIYDCAVQDNAITKLLKNSETKFED